jgi:hypothetical protein
VARGHGHGHPEHRDTEQELPHPPSLMGLASLSAGSVIVTALLQQIALSSGRARLDASVCGENSP